MIRLAMLAVIAVALAAPVSASGQLRTSVARDLRGLGFHGVEVAELTSSQLSAIHAVAHSDASQTRKRLSVRSILGGRNTLRSLLR